MRSIHKLMLAAAALVLACAWMLPAQRNQEDPDPNTRGVEGVVFDADENAVPRAVVQLKDMRTLQIRSFITQGGGDYRFSGLSKDIDYELRATYQGKNSDTKRLSVFDNRPIANINLQLEE